jgi:hypothetical protein
MKTFFYALLGFLAISSFSSAAKKAKDWSKVDFDKVEDEWKEGDSEEELITPDEVREMRFTTKNSFCFAWISFLNYLVLGLVCSFALLASSCFVRWSAVKLHL